MQIDEILTPGDFDILPVDGIQKTNSLVVNTPPVGTPFMNFTMVVGFTAQDPHDPTTSAILKLNNPYKIKDMNENRLNTTEVVLTMFKTLPPPISKKEVLVQDLYEFFSPDNFFGAAVCSIFFVVLTVLGGGLFWSLIFAL